MIIARISADQAITDDPYATGAWIRLILPMTPRPLGVC